MQTIRYVKRLSVVAALMLLPLVQSASANHHGGGHKTPATNTIVDVAVGSGNFTTLVTAIKAAGLVDTLSGEGPFTVLAPTNAAFAALPEGALEGLLADPAALKRVLTLHVIAGKAMAADVVGMTAVNTLEGTSLQVSAKDGVSVGGANVSATDIEATNGVIHAIDSVILR